MKYIRFILIPVAILLMSYFLPLLYDYLFTRSDKVPFVLYSEVEQTFVKTEVQDDKLLRSTIDGAKEYTEVEFDSILPTFYARQLVADNRFPDTLLGRKINFQAVRATNFIHRFSPKDINRTPPKAYQLIESASGRVNLNPAEDIFVFRNHRICFINGKTNALDEEKNERFNSVFLNSNLSFPIYKTAGNGNARKEYDEGYLLLDSKGSLFHFKQVEGKPYLEQIATENLSAPILYMELCGFTDRSKLAYIYTEDGALYFLKHQPYSFQKVDLPKLKHTQEGWMAIGNMFYTTYRIQQNDGVSFIAIETESGNQVASHTIKFETDKVEQIGNILFPFRLTFSSGESTHIYPRGEFGNLYTLALSLVLALIYFIRYRKRVTLPLLALSSALILLSGIYGFMALILLGKRS